MIPGGWTGPNWGGGVKFCNGIYKEKCLKFYVPLGFKIAQAVKDWQIAEKKTHQKFSFNVKSSCGIGILNVDVFEVRETPRILTTAANSQIVSP